MGVVQRMADGTILSCTLSSELEGRDIVIGVRPEHFILSSSGVEAKLLTVEPTGPEIPIMVALACGEAIISFRDRINVAAGDYLKIRPMDDKIHVFDVASGIRINNNPQGGTPT
jgi:multiple sugar transport system ATP-binding protein